MLTKTWSTKSDFEAGTLNNVLVPEGLNRLELKRKALSGTATYIFNHYMANWLGFEHTKDNTKIILRDEFRENTLAEYYLETMFGTWGYTAPTYDSANKRISFNTWDNKGFSMRPKGISIQNFILSYKFKGTSKYPENFGFLSMGRWVDNDNMYMTLINDAGSPYLSAIGKAVAGAWTELKAGAVYHSVGTERQLKTTFNGSSLKVELVGVGSISVSDGTFPNAGPVKVGAYQGVGWIDNLLLEHYSLPDPPNCSVSFRFAVSSDNVHWNPWVTDFEDCGNSRYLKIEVTLSRNSLASAMPTLESMTVSYETRKQQPIFI